MSIQAVAWALEQDLPARPKLVLVSIANHANHVDGYCWLKAETIGHEAACTPRSVYNFIGMLVRNGFIRKAKRWGEDGKQRANDYWILFDREEKPWDASAHLEADGGEGDGEENAPAEVEGPISGMPGERHSPGENEEPSERHDSRQPVDIPAGSPGPGEAAFSHKRIAEPSESNPKASSARARVHPSTLRSYRAPPPQPVAEDTALASSTPIFVYEGTPAYEAWAAHFARKNGTRSWHLTTRKFVEAKDDQPGQWRSGWWFPSLFPPGQPPPAQPQQGPSDQDIRDFK